jgi:hypothetical protein
MRQSRKTLVIVSILVAVSAFFAWRFLRPMNIFIVDEKFERPIDTSIIPSPLTTLRAEECAACHKQIYEEWKTTIHSQAWTDPYFQVDWKFDRYQQICKNCHIPLDRQQEHKVLGFRDKEKWDPILAPNPDFDPRLQHEGVTCTACHLREGKIIGTRGDTNAPHPVKKISDPNEVCAQCHIVEGERWDTFFRFPPCGTVAEIKATKGALSSVTGKTGEIVVADIKGLGCVQCHMPLVQRPVATGAEARQTRQHLWRGGHDPEMVKKGLAVQLEKTPSDSPGKRSYTLTLTNVGAAHYLPTGTPDRHLSVHLRGIDRDGKVLNQRKELIKRTVMWRPFIIDLWDTRLPRWQPRVYHFEFSTSGATKPVAVEAVVRYHLLDERRRKRIGYENEEPISYEVFRKRIAIDNNQSDQALRQAG